MVDLLGGLIVPRAPRLPTIERHHRALIEAEEHALTVRRVDPHLLRIVSAWGALESGEAVPAVRGSVTGRIDRVDDVRVLWVDVNATVVAALAVTNSLIVGGHLAPRRTAIIRAIQPGVRDQKH